MEKWMHQNGASYTGTMVEGCLLDNFVLVCRRGFAAVYEHYLNCWSSNYLVEFEPGAAQNVWERWYQFETAAVSEETEPICGKESPPQFQKSN